MCLDHSYFNHVITLITDSKSHKVDIFLLDFSSTTSFMNSDPTRAHVSSKPFWQSHLHTPTRRRLIWSFNYEPNDDEYIICCTKIR